MITVTDSPQHTGVIIRGGADDFYELYEALNYLLDRIDGQPDGQIEESGISLRILSFCYDLRHSDARFYQQPYADSGDEQQVNTDPSAGEGKILPFQPGRLTPANDKVEEFIDEDDLKFEESAHEDDDEEWEDEAFGTVGSRNEIRLLWPEALYFCYALNSYLGSVYALRAARKYKDLDRTPAWLTVRKMQILIIDCVCGLFSDSKAKSIRNLYYDPTNYDHTYCTQYIDKLTADYVKLPLEKRLQRLGLLPKWIISGTQEYRDLQSAVRTASHEYGVPAHDIDIGIDYPAEVEW